jgi:predicted transcriptional regulator
VAITAPTLAADLGVHEGDVDVLLELLDEHSPELSDELAAFLRRVFDP